MSRYRAEFDRLYVPPGAASPSPDAAAGSASPGAGDLIGPDGHVRALVLDVGRPVEWPLVATLWRAVQDELDLPAPAIAIAGEPSFQLWWSLAEAVPVQDAHRFLQALQRRFLPTVKPARVRSFPTTGEGLRWTHARRVPEQVGPDQWSAFVAPGLAPVFEETPWVDVPPNEDGQAELLSGLRSLSPQQWKETLERLAPVAEPAAERSAQRLAQTPPGQPPGQLLGQPSATPQPGMPQSGSDTVGAASAQVPSGETLTSPAFDDPRRFLLHVMNDNTAPLALRIEAAKALLPYAGDR